MRDFEIGSELEEASRAAFQRTRGWDARPARPGDHNLLIPRPDPIPMPTRDELDDVIVSSRTAPEGDVAITRYEGSDVEVRVIDPKTGGAKGQKETQCSALDPIALDYLGRVAGMGAEKYDRYNYLKGYAWHLSVDAAMRHLLAFWAGEDRDPESGLPHTSHAAWHLNALTSFLHRGIGTDDRPPR